MKRLDAALSRFLETVDAVDEGAMGGSHAPPMEGVSEALLMNLRTQQKTNAGIINVIVALHVAMFTGALFLVFAYHQSPTVLVAVLGGSYLSLIKILSSLKELWAEKAIMDLLVTTAPLLPPEQLITLAQEIFFANKGKGKASTRGKPESP